MTSTAVRRLLAACTLVGVSALLVVGGAGAASADTPVPQPGSWEPKPDIDVLHAFLVLGGIPLLVFVVITLLYVAPALARGENLGVNALEPESQWLGGPRKAAGELAEPDSEDSKAGGAGGTW
ncbi:hypothetical protein ACIRN4_07345 [Pimelobacter simplex]|uniref:Uncharacterized protein n=1 Tax=Nocardioides simplex TaxID=2045 RepID=A0A0A1DHE7_NOCSI|nr:hypothetical protein [Pimelobacter simplex]AIY16801.1 hypothetical protein KR76_08525 [Pimelobacter simplex]KAB2809198.1 hypothetical protein F9L07_19305 [Pimelobacter simplex]MCG8151876.1 hypothetical protein [Pimelobacter simplex]